MHFEIIRAVLRQRDQYVFGSIKEQTKQWFWNMVVFRVFERD